MKKTVCILALVACMSGLASADMMPGPDFTSTISWGSGRILTSTYSYTHTIGGPYTPIPGAYTVDPGSVKLAVTFADIFGNENVNIYALNNGTWDFLSSTGNIPNRTTTTYDVGVSADLLNVAGTLTVGLNETTRWGSTILKQSVLTGDVTQVVPVPGAFLLGMLGLGLAGAKLRKRA